MSRAIRGGKYPKFVYNEKKAAFRQEAAIQYYNDTRISEAALRTAVPLQASSLLFNGKIPSKADVIRSSQYLQSELPVRIAHRIRAFNFMPFIVVTNPSILRVMEIYKKSFHVISEFNRGKQITTTAQDEEFAFLLGTLMENHGNEIEELSNGLREARAHILDVNDGDEAVSHEVVKAFLDENLTARLAVRLLVQHHLLLRNQVSQDNPTRDRIGIIEKKWKPADEIMGVAEKIRGEWEQFCETPPIVKVAGHTEAMFPYIPMGINYILQELLKNAFRAVIESPHSQYSDHIPPIEATIAVNNIDFVIRISDRGKGIPPAALDKIWYYHFTTTRFKKNNSVLQNLTHSHDEKGLAGYGIGLPVSKAYAEYLGGHLQIKSLDGIGSDVYVTLKHLDPVHGDSIRI